MRELDKKTSEIVCFFQVLMLLWKGEEVWVAGKRTISFPFALLIRSGHFTPTSVAEAETGGWMWDPRQDQGGFRIMWVSQPRTLWGKG